jgi:HK97 family phage portal protein
VPFIQSGGTIVGTPSSVGPTPGAGFVTRPFGISVYGGLTAAYELIYATQPNVRTVVSFLGRNVAQLHAKLYERVSDTERAYRRDHPLDRLLRRPVPVPSPGENGPRVARYSFMRALVEDLGIFDNHVSLKVRAAGDRLALIRIPPQYVEPVGLNLLFPDGFRITSIPGAPIFAAGDVLHLHGYNPIDPRWGLSPIETLRRLLAEDIAAGQYREQMWDNGARINGVIQRPIDAPPWRDAARDRFRQDFAGAYTGAGPEAGGTPVLEDGMTWQNVAFTSKENEYLDARKLTRAEVAAAYHVDPSMVGIMDSANIANADAAHTRLYQDTLTPLTAFIEEELTLQLLPEFESDPAALDLFYIEHNLDEKLRGDFQTEAEAASRAVGAPWLTRNEQRARRNLPPVDGGDELITPLNVTTGGRANPADTAPGTPGLGQAARRSSSLPYHQRLELEAGEKAAGRRPFQQTPAPTSSP